jgi:PiT family inorganic phosphate transporter
MVPVSSSQVIVGCVIGIGLYKGARNINFKLLGEIATGWLATPVMSGLLAFFSLFFMKNIFNINVGHKIAVPGTEVVQPANEVIGGGAEMSEIIKYLLLGIMVVGIVVIIYYYLLERKKNRELRRSEDRFWKNLK